MKGSRLSRKARVQMPRKRLSVPERLLLGYLKLGDSIVDRLFRGKLTQQEKRELKALDKQFPDNESVVSNYLASRRSRK